MVVLVLRIVKIGEETIWGHAESHRLLGGIRHGRDEAVRVEGEGRPLAAQGDDRGVAGRVALDGGHVAVAVLDAGEATGRVVREVIEGSTGVRVRGLEVAA